MQQGAESFAVLKGELGGSNLAKRNMVPGNKEK
jgi:hypothetical protein